MFMEIEETSQPRDECEVKAVKGVTSFHQVCSGKSGYEIKTRNLSCFCSGCLSDMPDHCISKEYVKPFTQRQLAPV